MGEEAASRRSRTRHRVVVTGVGVVSPIGVGTEAFWAAALAGTVGTGEIRRFDTTGCRTHQGGEVVDPDGVLGATPPGGPAARTTRFAVASTGMAVEDAGVDGHYAPTRVGVCFGIVVGNRPLVEASVRAAGGGRLHRGAVDQHWLEPAMVGRAPAEVHGFRGPNMVLATACAAGNSAIAYGTEMIAGGRADAMVVGGADELSEAMFFMFNSFRGLASDVVAPFDRHRGGMMISEGAGALFLESRESAVRRDAHLYGEVLGHGNFCDAHHMTTPHPEGLGAIRSMAAALARAGVGPEDIDYISAHGTGTQANDAVEASVIRKVMGEHSDRVPVSSVKGMLGHMQGAAGAVGAICCLLAMRDGMLPPNVNYREPDPLCDLNIVANETRPHRVRVALNNAFGFGGNNSCTVFGAP